MKISKVLIVFALSIVSISCLTKQFELSEKEKQMMKDIADSSKDIKRSDLLDLFQIIINKTMANYGWNSQIFPNEFAKELIKDAIGESNTMSSVDLKSFVSQNRFSKIYQSYFDRIITTLANYLQMDEEDLKQNVETYNLSFDTYYILDFKI